ncbi:GH116 family glycosyl-hydrolase [Flavivirga spongiicola]|uniref:Non-lysosomal glucosylceramidase n=1 Tax=Flavivirga spongiicola TaxID=421621 RepID=A0ABU7XTA1_9FLAO|nr:GH116 family glycosyl-hydrolase [Flavivirga sp. MEBiC05379]MDO5979013.1 GH116 family glycosyl hydrolase [Flavivirga sp. MEBiC05379]
MKRLIVFVIMLLGSSVGFSQVARELESKEVTEQSIENKDELLADYYKLSNEPGLLSRGQNTVYKGDHLGAIQFPVGGIGTGCIQYDGNAVPRYWQIFNNMGHGFIPNSFFAIRVKNQNDIKVRALQTEDVGPFKGMDALEATSEFPFLKYNFQDDIAVKVSMEVYNPFIPTNLKDSGIPAVFYQFTIKNPTDSELEISLLSSQQNAIGYSKIPIKHTENGFAYNFKASKDQKNVVGNTSRFYEGNRNSVATENGTKILYMEGNEDTNDEHFGQMALMLFEDKNAEGIASWTNEKSLYDSFSKKGSINGKDQTNISKDGNTWTGALNTSFVMQAGEKKVVNMALLWYFPNGKNGGFMDKWDGWGKGNWEGDGNQYASHWKHIKELTAYVRSNYKNLTQNSRSFSNTFYSTNLPHWLTERIGNQLGILKSRTFFHDKNGFVGMWEGTGGVDGSCAGNCNHVWHYAQSHARLFPELGRTIRNQTFNAIKENGQIPYRLPAGTPAFDGQCGDILGAYREYLLSPNSIWLKSQYPAIKKAMNYTINTHDTDKDGWLSDKPKHTTYDASMTGNPSFLSSLYLAALKASEKMAIAMNDIEQAKEWGSIAEKSAKRQDEKLWNGEYFIQVKGEKHATDYNDGCHSDQLLGQWWADQLGLGSLYPNYKIKSATEAVLKYNFKSNLKKHNQGHRTFALPEEAGMIATTWPNNDRPKYASGYSSEVWTTFEYTIGASLLKYNKIQDALTILRSGYNRYDGKLRTGYIGVWGNFGFSGNPFGDDECGQFYGRALSIWSVLLAAQGFEYNGPEQSIEFNPKWKPENHKSFFSTAEGWGRFSQKRKDNNEQVNILDIKYGALNLSKITLHSDSDKKGEVKLKLNGQNILTSVDKKKNRYELAFNETTLKIGDILEVIISIEKKNNVNPSSNSNKKR